MLFSRKYEIIRLSEIGSTNLHASALLSGNMIKTPTIILTDYQYQGKGQGGNTWESEAGKNVLISLIQFPKNIKAFEQFYISKITAIAIKETIKEHSMQAVIKWPNDVLVGNEKIAGILIENTLEAYRIRDSIIGIGINVNQVEFHPYPMKATSMKNISSGETSLQLVIEKFIERFDFWYEIMEYRDFNQIDKEYLAHLYGFQKLMTFRKEGNIFEGMIIDVEKDGKLVLLMNENKKQRFGYKELEFMMFESDE
jgi:BirA family biotin operon repressor/biotin-[acetyl-CoA-carboxylase] ligase